MAWTQKLILFCCVFGNEGRLGAPAPPSGVQAIALYARYGSFAPYVLGEVGKAGRQVPVLIDSGSPLFWSRAADIPGCNLPGFLPDATQALGSNLEFGYGGGMVRGALYNTSFTWKPRHGVPKVLNDIQVMAATTEVGMGCSDGILGMDMASMAAPSIFESQGLPHLFTILLNRIPFANGDSLVEAGSLTLGGIDQDSYSGGLACIPMLPMEKRINSSKGNLNPQGVPLNNTAWWQLEILGVRIGSRQFGPGQGIVDTGTSMLIFPPTLMRYIDTMTADVSCQSLGVLPPIVFTLAGGLEVSMEPSQYTLKGPDKSCNLAAAAMPDAPSDDFFVLGDPFFWKYVVAFDFAEKRIGLGLKAGVEGTPLQQTCDSALTR